jgi:methylmalonyl-CoA mutase
MLTDSIARAAWKLFQQVEAEGGYSKAEAAGSIEEALGVSRAARAKALSSRRKTLVGVNNYPNLMEIESDMQQPAEGHRLAEPFEKIRRRTIDNAKKARRYPRVLLLTRSDVKMRGARSNFALNFFGCATFEVETSDQYAGKDADMIVLCSSDQEYLEFAQDVCPKVSVPVLVAGNPKDQIEALEAAGVKGFIHVLSDVTATLTEWQDNLGLE